MPVVPTGGVGDGEVFRWLPGIKAPRAAGQRPTALWAGALDAGRNIFGAH